MVSSTTTSIRTNGATNRKTAPVFVLGCGRSGTTLLYHMLLSAGGFAIYRAESNAINLLEPRFGDLSRPRNRNLLLEAWFDSRLYELSGLDQKQVRAQVMAECRNGGDFLRIIMESMARQQGTERWADCTPEHLLYLDRIKETVPDALIIHIIRDGRDVALSMEKGNWIRPITRQKKQKLAVAGLYWEWIVGKGRQYGRKLGNDYMEVRFEELVTDPPRVLREIGKFIDHDLDYKRILENGIGSVSEPNTSFKGETKGGAFNPVGRWKEKFSPAEVRRFEGLVGQTLEELGYPLATTQSNLLESSKLKSRRALYRAYFNSKLWLKAKTPLGKLFVTKDLSWV
ncbi:MAG TPA: sulfotransferase [Candidatus Sulfotelmatobacter sp.]